MVWVGSNARAVKKNEMGREEPGPAKVIAWSERLNGDCAMPLQLRFEHHLSFQNEIKPIGRASFLKDGLPRFKLHFQR